MRDSSSRTSRNDADLVSGAFVATFVVGVAVNRHEGFLVPFLTRAVSTARTQTPRNDADLECGAFVVRFVAGVVVNRARKFQARGRGGKKWFERVDNSGGVCGV